MLQQIIRDRLQELLDEYHVHCFTWEANHNDTEHILIIESEYESGYEIRVEVCPDHVVLMVPGNPHSPNITKYFQYGEMNNPVQFISSILEEMISSKVYIKEFLDSSGFVQVQLIRHTPPPQEPEFICGQGTPQPLNYVIEHSIRMNHFVKGGRPS